MITRRETGNFWFSECFGGEMHQFVGHEGDGDVCGGAPVIISGGLGLVSAGSRCPG